MEGISHIFNNTRNFIVMEDICTNHCIIRAGILFAELCVYKNRRTPIYEENHMDDIIWTFEYHIMLYNRNIFSFH